MTQLADRKWPGVMPKEVIEAMDGSQAEIVFEIGASDNGVARQMCGFSRGDYWAGTRHCFVCQNVTSELIPLPGQLRFNVRAAFIGPIMKFGPPPKVYDPKRRMWYTIGRDSITETWETQGVTAYPAQPSERRAWDPRRRADGKWPGATPVSVIEVLDGSQAEIEFDIATTDHFEACRQCGFKRLDLWRGTNFTFICRRIITHLEGENRMRVRCDFDVWDASLDVPRTPPTGVPVQNQWITSNSGPFISQACNMPNYDGTPSPCCEQHKVAADAAVAKAVRDLTEQMRKRQAEYVVTDAKVTGYTLHAKPKIWPWAMALVVVNILMIAATIVGNVAVAMAANPAVGLIRLKVQSGVQIVLFALSVLIAMRCDRQLRRRKQWRKSGQRDVEDRD